LTILFFFILGAASGVELAPRAVGLPAKIFSALVFVAVSAVLARPLASSILLQRGIYYFNKSDYSLAREYAQKALLYDGRNWQAYSRLSEIHFTDYARTKNPAELQEAAGCQLKALIYCPQNAALHSDMAWLYLSEGRRGEALSEIKQAVALDRYNEKLKNTMILIENNHY